jgi:hypothetical protein
MTNKTDKNSNETRAVAPSKIDERTSTPTNPETDFFGPAIYTYSRKQALADGVQVEVPPAVAKEAGFKFPVYLTDTVYAAYVDVPDGLSGQDEDGRLWDILTMLHHAIRNAPDGAPRIPFSLYVQNEEEKAPTLVRLHAVCSAKDFDEPEPAITVMLPDED